MTSIPYIPVPGCLHIYLCLKSCLDLYYQIRSLKWGCVFLKRPLDPSFVFLLRWQSLCLQRYIASACNFERICSDRVYLYRAYYWYTTYYINRNCHSFHSLTAANLRFACISSPELLLVTELIARMVTVLVLYWSVLRGWLLEWFCTGVVLVLYCSALWRWLLVLLLHYCTGPVLLVLYWYI